MIIEYGYSLGISVDRPTPVQCLLDVHPERRGDIIAEEALHTVRVSPMTPVTDCFGNRMHRMIAPEGVTTFMGRGLIRDSGLPDHRAPARQLPVSALPPETLQFLLGSRYCETDLLMQEAWNRFGATPESIERVEAIVDFVHNAIRFDYLQARATRSATEALGEGVGVCRDFTHAAIAFCRCLNIPARYVNGYLGDIGVPPDPAPMDFSAWMEVYLDGGWYTFDPRHNQQRIGRIVVARGRDAMDVPMVHSFGPHVLESFEVTTIERPEHLVDIAA